jgi:pyruvate,water dikinase
VRSSATAEDLPDLSFAGQQETYLNIQGVDAVLDAVKRCWASLWTARAIGYRLRMGIDQASISMGVVVQRMVAADVAGVLFTANPTTGARDELVVDASFGLGEAVVSGQVTPDHFVLDRTSLAVTAQVLTDRQGRRSLSEPQLRELGGLAMQVENVFDRVPMDIEWALADGRLWLLQARPMTGLPPAQLLDVRWEPPIPGTQWVRRQVAENMPEPLSPLFEDLYLREGMDLSMDNLMHIAGYGDLVGAIEHPWYITVNGYAYMRGSFNVTWQLALKSMAASSPANRRTLENAGPRFSP